MIRALDILIAAAFLVLLSPILLVLAVMVTVSSGWPFLFRQTRVGLKGKDFKILKLRTMRKDAEKMGQLTVGMKDKRITPLGYFLRKYKLDELPQLWNVLVGQMSIVGPRPEVRKYVNAYTPEQLRTLNVRPGITDDSAIHFIDENNLLEGYDDPEKGYIEKILPEKMKLSAIWLNDPSLVNYFRIIFQTIRKLFI